MRERARSTLIILPVAIVAVALGGLGSGALVLLLTALAAGEVERLLAGTRRTVVAGGVTAGAILIVTFSALPVMLASGVLGRPDSLVSAAARFAAVGLLAVIGIVAVGIGLAAFAWREPSAGFDAWTSTLFGAVYVGLFGAVAELAGHSVGTGIWGERLWVVVLLAAVWSFDTGAYLVGRQIGARAFFPWISPRKTTEGVIGGLVVATAVTALVLALAGFSPAEGLLLGPLLGIAAQAGDLAESMLKRAAGAKDSGTLIPGHGGVLDRFDSLIFAAPVLLAWVEGVHG